MPISKEVLSRAEASTRMRRLNGVRPISTRLVRVLTAPDRPTVLVSTQSEEFVDCVVRYCFGYRAGQLKHEWEFEGADSSIESDVAESGAGTNRMAAVRK